MKKLFILLLVIVTLSGCKFWKKDDQIDNRWAHRLPYTLSYKFRKQKLDRGNLIIDYSFEQSRQVLHDTGNKSYFLKGWDKTGPEVELIDLTTDSLADKNDVFHGKKSIKIHRYITDETDDLGYGISSDYIKIIPGEYTFSCYLKMKNIVNPEVRIGNKLNDAINVRVIYYDKNKNEISSRDFNKEGGYYIDKSFKAVSYANYWHIDSLPWHRFIAKACYPPYHDAITSHEAKFVRLFIGLKGKGTLWIDRVSFRYSESNFTLKEKLDAYTDTVFAKYDLILPTPKSVKGLESLRLVKEDNSIPLIVRPAGSDNATELALKLLEENIRNSLNIDTGLIKNNKLVAGNALSAQIESGRIIFCLGHNPLHDKYKEHLPYKRIRGRKQGYFIYTYSDLPNVVFISGNSSTGLYYGVLTAIQLLDKERGLFHNANIYDYPDRNERSVMLSEVVNATNNVNEIEHYKINSIYMPYAQLYSNIGKMISELWKLSPVMDIHIYTEPESGSSESNIPQITEFLHTYSAIFDGFLYLSDNPLPHRRYFHSNRYSCDLSGTHEKLFRKIYNGIAGNTMFLQFLPPCHNNQLIDHSQGKAECYLQELSITLPGKASLLWTGNAVVAGQIDEAEIYRFKHYTENRKITFLDNQLFATSLDFLLADKDSTNSNQILTNGLFYPFQKHLDTRMSKHFEQVIINVQVTDIFNVIRTCTAAEYLWNSRKYNANLTLYKILVSRYGIKNAKMLILLNDIYVNMVIEMRNLEDTKNMNKQFRQIDLMLENYYNLAAKISDKRASEIITIFNSYVASIERNLAKTKRDAMAANKSYGADKKE